MDEAAKRVEKYEQRIKVGWGGAGGYLTVQVCCF